MQTPTEVRSQFDFEDRPGAQLDGWAILSALWKGKKFILGVAFVSAIIAIIVSLLLPAWYKGSTRLLLPEGGSGGLTSALLGDVSAVAESFIGGSGDYKRYLAILSSRSAAEHIVEEYNLEEVYGTSGSSTSMTDAIEILRSKVEFVIDDQFEFLSIEVLDRDPQRAADIANAYAQQLNTINSRLSSQSAAQFTEFVDRRLNEAMHERDSLQTVLQGFRQEHGLLDLPVQLEAYYVQLGELQANAAEAQIQYEALRTQFGPSNPQVISFKNLVDAANDNFRKARSGAQPLLPVAQDTLPSLLSTYADLELQRIIQDRILEVVAPLAEQAKFEEQKQFSAVQVVDVAIPPDYKALPQKKIIVIVTTLSALLLASLYVLLIRLWNSHSSEWLTRITAPNRNELR